MSTFDALLNHILIALMSVLLANYEKKDNHKIMATLWILNVSIRLGLIISVIIEHCFLYA